MIEFFDALGWPVERFIGRPVTNFIRLCLHTRGVRIKIGKVPPFEVHEGFAPYTVAAPSAGTQRTVAGGPQPQPVAGFKGTSIECYSEAFAQAPDHPDHPALQRQIEAERQAKTPVPDPRGLTSPDDRA